VKQVHTAEGEGAELLSAAGKTLNVAEKKLGNLHDSYKARRPQISRSGALV
jgi:hypothetical protein